MPDTRDDYLRLRGADEGADLSAGLDLTPGPIANHAHPGHLTTNLTAGHLHEVPFYDGHVPLRLRPFAKWAGQLDVTEKGLRLTLTQDDGTG